MIHVLSGIQLFVTPWTTAHQAALSMVFSRHEYWSGLPFPSPGKWTYRMTWCIFKWPFPYIRPHWQHGRYSSHCYKNLTIIPWRGLLHWSWGNKEMKPKRDAECIQRIADLFFLRQFILFFKVFIEFVKILLLFYISVFLLAYGILAPWPRIAPVSPALEGWSLNHWTIHVL